MSGEPEGASIKDSILSSAARCLVSVLMTFGFMGLYISARLDGFRVNSVVLYMCAYKTNEHDSDVVSNMHHQTVCVSPDIEHDPVVRKKVR